MVYLNYYRAQEIVDRYPENVFYLKSVSRYSDGKKKSIPVLDTPDTPTVEFYIIYSVECGNTFYGVYKAIPLWYSKLFRRVKNECGTKIANYNKEITKRQNLIEVYETVSERNKPKHKKNMTFWDDNVSKRIYCDSQSSICRLNREIENIERKKKYLEEQSIFKFEDTIPDKITGYHKSFRMIKVSLDEKIGNIGYFYNLNRHKYHEY